MRKLLALEFALFLMLAPIHAMQGPGGQAGIGGKAGIGGGSTIVSTVSIDNHLRMDTNDAGGTACADGTTTSTGPSVYCQLSATNGFMISHTGDAVDITLQLCFGPSCNVAPNTPLTLTDGTNTYTLISAASQTSNGTLSQYRFYAVNATAGTYTLNLGTTSAGGNLIYYVRAEAVTLLNANTTTPLDTSISNTANGSGTAASVASAGNVSQSGEVVIAGFNCVSGTPSNSGSYATLDTSATDSSMYVQKTGPASGASTTAAITCGASGAWVGSIAGYHP